MTIHIITFKISIRLTTNRFISSSYIVIGRLAIYIDYVMRKKECDTKRRCGCRKKNCQQREEKNSPSLSTIAPNAISSSRCSSSSSSGVVMQCEEATYDPSKHNALWHNNNPFVLEECTAKRTRCRGCESKLLDPKELDLKFVISHKEQREVSRSRGRKIALQKAFYHCSASCISPRHPYFKPSAVTIKPSVVRRLTATDVQLIKHHGIDLTFLRTT